MTTSRTLILGLASCAAAGALAATAAAGPAIVPACKGADLTGSFLVVPGSAGAGNVLYTVRLRNRSSRACFVSGIPLLRLLDRNGHALPTHVRPAHPGQLTAVRVVLPPGGYAAATARFSPDVPGPGEGHPGACEPRAYSLRVSPQPGGGSLVAPGRPPTPVCEHGSMTLTVLVAGRNGPKTL